MEINIKESTMVKPAEDLPKQSLWLSNLDLTMVRYHVLTVYFYKPNGSSNFFEAQVLKEALSKTLVRFYPVAGRLRYDSNGRLEILCNGEGTLFVDAEATFTSMDDVIESFMSGSDVSWLVPKVDYSGGLSSYPLLAVQITTFKCGGVSLGMAFHHTVIDGPSAHHFLNTWNDIAREGSSSRVAPFIDRTILRARQPPTPKFHHVEYDPLPTRISTSIPDSKPSSVVSFLKITASQINSLKAKVSEKHYSTYLVLTAHIWRCVTKARSLEHEQQVKLFMLVDGRNRFEPPLPQGYLGNAIFCATPMALAGDFETESFSDTITRLDESLKRMNDEYLRSAIDHLEKYPQFKRGPYTMKCPNLSVNSWIRLPMYEHDFGWGSPVLMGPANVGCEGKVYILPTPSKDGGLFILAHLEASHKELFEKHFYEFI